MLILALVIMSVLLSATTAGISSEAMTVTQVSKNAPVVIGFDVQEDNSYVVLKIYNSSNVLIATVYDGVLNSGQVSFSWSPNSSLGGTILADEVIVEKVEVGSYGMKGYKTKFKMLK